MGPSGAGKTTLLNLLSGRQKTLGTVRSGTQRQQAQLTGEVFCSGQPVKPSFFRRRTAYVVQDNALLDTDTARESLEFSAYLRLPATVSEKQRTALVDRLLDTLHLNDCADTIVGGPRLKGLSGGEQKRTAVGIELISDPKIIFLDEPLTGLDSYNAFELTQTLKRLANTGVTVMMTLHQPSSDIYAMIDEVIVLGKGSVVYQGASIDMAGHFQQLGLPCPRDFNPSDHVMSLLVKDGGTNVQRLQDAWPRSAAHRQLLARLARAKAGPGNEELSDSSDTEDKEAQTVPKVMRNCFQVQGALFRREFRRTWRSRRQVLGIWLQTLMVSLVYAWLFMGAGRELGAHQDPACSGPSGSPLQCVRYTAIHWGALSMLAVDTVNGGTGWAISVFQESSSSFLREVSGGYYSCAAHLLSKSALELCLVGINRTVTIFAAYWLMGLQAHPIVLVLEIILLSVSTSSLIYCISALITSPQLAMQIAPLSNIPQFAFAGILLPIQMVPVSLRWVKWLCPLYHAMNMIAVSEFHEVYDVHIRCQSQSTAPAPGMCAGAQVQLYFLESQGVRYEYFWWPAFGSCCIIIFVCRFASTFVLQRRIQHAV